MDGVVAGAWTEGCGGILIHFLATIFKTELSMSRRLDVGRRFLILTLSAVKRVG
jgi:hypothetical protein